MSRFKRVAMTILVLTVAGCGSKAPPDAQAEPPESTSPVAESMTQPPTPSEGTGASEGTEGVAAATIENTHWSLVQLAGSEPVVTPADRAEAYFELVSSDHRMQGNGGCNRMSGAYELSGESLKFGPVMSTKMACADPRNPEAGFMKAIEATAAVRLSADTLELLDAGGATLATLRARPAIPR